MSIGCSPADTRSTQLMKTIDHLNQKMGKGTIKLAAEISSQHWQAKQLRLSKKYTTSWNDLLIVHA